MQSANPCPKCGSTSSSDQLDGLCPRCLLATGKEPGLSESANDETLDSTTSLTVGQLWSAAEEFGDYELIEEIARGGMGVIYRARHKRLNRVVALKMILQGQLASENDVRRFYLEAESAANLDHPGIVPIYEIGEHDGHHFFSMKLIEGGSLADHLPELRTDTRQIVKLIADVARAVHHAHVRGILHRDLKPANILLDEDCNPLVSDLGLAKRIQTDSDITGTGAIVGTPAYMPPEQAAADKEITTSADIYSIGAMLYEALLGRPPHQAESPLKMLMKVIEAEITSPREIDNKIDRSLELICMKCLDRDPTRRYSSAAALAEDLENWLQGRRVSARPPSMASVVSEVFYGNLRSAIGAAAIGVAAGMMVAFGLFTSVVANNFGEGREFDLRALYEALPSMPRQQLLLAAVPEKVYGPAILGAIFVYLFSGLALERLVRPKTIREAIALSLVAGMFMTVTDFAGAMGNLFMGDDILTRQAREIRLLTDASLQVEASRDQAVSQLREELPELNDYPPERQSELLAKSITVRTAMYMAKLMWASLLLTSCICLVSCVAGGVHAFRLRSVESRLWKIVIPYCEVMLLSIFLLALLTIQLIATFEISNNAGRTIPQFSASRLLSFCVVLVALIPGFGLWKWYWRWMVYPVAIAMLWWLLAS